VSRTRAQADETNWIPEVPTVKRSLRTAALGAAAVALLFTAAACGGDDESADTTTTTQDATTTTASEQPGTILEVATADGNFTTLAALVTQADLAATLSGEGPFTVFAPTDAAFEAVPQEILDLVGSDEELLKTVLTYHVVAGRVASSDLSDGQVIDTVAGETLTVKIEGGKVFLVDGAGQEIEVTTPDVEASNGVIHVLGGVLLPVDPSTLL
jgi:uncharacterized surface protein with fasciclin (FAS1) repeats